MGSWNATCLLSGLSIRWESPTVAIFLATKSDSEIDPGGCCYPDEYWFPVGLPMKGTYSDYGIIEDVEEGRAIDVNMELLMDGVHGINDRYEEPKDIEGLMNMAERGYMGWKPYYDYKVGIALVHAEVWDHTLDLVSKIEHWMGRSVLEWFNERVDTTLERYNDVQERMKKRGFDDEINDMQKEHEISNALDLWRMSATRGLTREEWTNYALIRYFLQMMGKKWDVQSNKGGQDHKWKEVSEYQKYTSNLAIRLQKDWDEECGE